MARFAISTEGTEVALTAATERTIVQVLAATGVPIRVVGFAVFFDASAAAEPVQIKILRQTTAGSGGTSVTPRKLSTMAYTVQATAIKSPTSEPTAGDILAVYEISPTLGFEKMLDEAQIIEVASDGRVGLSCKAPAGVNCEAFLICEEIVRTVTPLSNTLPASSSVDLDTGELGACKIRSFEGTASVNFLVALYKIENGVQGGSPFASGSGQAFQSWLWEGDESITASAGVDGFRAVFSNQQPDAGIATGFFLTEK